jgi:ABC-type antimicrobial peptide transport system permease subunit
MTDQQFNAIILHLRALIVILGLLVGIVLGVGWQYLP